MGYESKLIVVQEWGFQNPDERKKLSEAHKGKKLSEEHKRKISEGLKRKKEKK